MYSQQGQGYPAGAGDGYAGGQGYPPQGVAGQTPQGQAPGYDAAQYGGQAYGYDNYGSAGVQGYGAAGAQGSYGPAGTQGYGYPPPGPSPAGMQGGYGYGPPPMGPMRGRMGGPGGYGPANRWAAVRLRGLPFGVHEHEINLFLGLDSVDVLMVRRGGRATGEAFVVLPHPADLDAALRKNRAYMGSRYIEVFEAGRQEYYKAITAALGYDAAGGRAHSPEGARSRSRSPLPGREIGPAGPPAHNGSTVVKLRGLPFSATSADVIAFFDDPSLGLPPLDPEKVLLPVGPDGRASGLAFVEFDSPELAAAALSKDRQTIGTRYVECFPSTQEERERYR